MKKEILNYILEKNKNVIINGAISTGKTKAIAFTLVDKMIERKESLLILDAKEEYANKYYNTLKEKNYNVITINLKSFEKSDSWNPLEYPYNLYKEGNVDRAVEYIENIGRIMFYEGSNADPFWAKTATDFLIGLSLVLFKEAKNSEINFGSINNLLESFNKKWGSEDYLTTYFNNIEKKSPEYIYASSTAFAPTDTKASIVAIAKQKMTSYVSSEKLSNLLNKTSFKYENIISKPTAVFIVTREENNKYNELASIFIEQLFHVLIDKENVSNFNFILDNIDTIEKFESLNNMLSSGIKSNIKFYILTRSLEELNNKYGTYMNKLSNIIKLTNHTMKITIEEEITIDDNDLNIKNAIDYPTTIKNNIENFNLETYLKGKAKKQIEIKQFNSKDVDDLVAQIDKKIDELEQEEQKEKKAKEKNETPKQKIIIDIKNTLGINDEISVEELINKIDKKIAELEEKEKDESSKKIKDNPENNQIKSLDNNKFSVEDLIAKIDERIKELDEELEQNNKTKKTSSKKEEKDNKTSKDIINQINEKLKELEEQEKPKKEVNSIAEFQQFKIDK